VAVLLLVSGGIWYGSNFQTKSEKKRIALEDSLTSKKKNSSKSLNSKTTQNITEGDSNHTKNTFETNAETSTNQVVTNSENGTENHISNSTFGLTQNQKIRPLVSNPKGENTAKVIETQITYYQKIKSESDTEQLNPTSEVLESENLTSKAGKKSEQKENQKALKKTQKVEIIIKMGSQGSNRQSPRNEKMKELFPEADSIEKVQKQKTRFGRVLKQVKNFKNGDKVDLNQLKKNPETHSSTQN